MSELASRRLPEATLPDRIVLDANVMIECVVGAFQPSRSKQGDQALQFLRELDESGITAIAPPTAYSEFIHTMIRFRYERELRERRDEISTRYGTRISSWTALYKRDGSILRHHVLELERMRAALAANRINVVSPNELAPLAVDQQFDQELIRMIGRYGLDTSDCLILMEAARLGVRSVVTMDRDLLRAQSDFDIYTW